LKRFYEFKDLDWTVEENIGNIKKYMESLELKRHFDVPDVQAEFYKKGVNILE